MISVYHKATATHLVATVLTVLGVAAPNVYAQTGWRPVGNWVVDRSLAGLATGPVNRVWYSDSGSILIETASRRVFETTDLETWRSSKAAVPAEPVTTVAARPEPGARISAVCALVIAISARVSHV